jgi:RNA polymerase sigma factor (sigma-70 family)
VDGATEPFGSRGALLKQMTELAMSSRELDEGELVRRAQLGSTAAFDRLVLSRGPDLYRFLVVRLRNESDARDALQETLTSAWRGLSGLRQREKFWPWLLAIAARQAATTARRRPPREDYDVELLTTDDEHTVEIRDALQRLPAKSREILVLRYALQLSEAEVAELLGIRVGTVKSRSARARTALMELLT